MRARVSGVADRRIRRRRRVARRAQGEALADRFFEEIAAVDDDDVRAQPAEVLCVAGAGRQDAAGRAKAVAMCG